MTESNSPSAEPSSKRTWLVLSGLVVIVIVVSIFTNAYFGLGIGLITLFCSRSVLGWSMNPLTARKWQRFKCVRRGYGSFIVLGSFWFLSLFSEVLVSDRAIVVHYEGNWYFPTFAGVYLSEEFGTTGTEAYVPVNYRELDERFEKEDDGNFVLMPIVPYGPNENLALDGILKPQAPSWERQHYLGTDGTGRDILARLVYGFRIALFFSIAFTVLTYIIGIVIGCLMGYFGGVFDLVFQRLIEIWSNIPFIYTVLILFSVIPASLDAGIRIAILLVVMVLFSWTGMTYYMRTGTLKERARDYSAAAIVLGASSSRVIFRHILPNTLSTLVTFVPFTISSAIAAITALDFLGYGLPPPTPSMGELLKQGRDNITTAPWIVLSAFVSLTLLLTLVTFVGEAIRESFDPKKFTKYV